MSATPHDALFRAILDSPDRAAVLIREYLPEELRQELAETSPRLVDGSFVDEALRGSQSDRLFEVDLKNGKSALVYVLIEHKSTPELRTPLQLLGYQLRIWDRHARGQGGSFRALPPIVPLVFYHGRESWTVPRSLFEMIDAPESLQLFVRSLGYVLHDLGQIELGRLSSDEGLMAGLAALKFVIEANVPSEVLYRILAALPQDGFSFEGLVRCGHRFRARPCPLIGDLDRSPSYGTEAPAFFDEQASTTAGELGRPRSRPSGNRTWIVARGNDSASSRAILRTAREAWNS